MKTILITGASDGIGKQLALQLQSDDVQLILCGRSQEKLENVLQQLKCPAFGYAFDMCDLEARTHFLNEIRQNHQKIDVFLNNAGANTARGTIATIDLNDFNYMMELNCSAPLQLIQGIYPLMKQHNEGHIINVLSTCCRFINENIGAYTASKMAMEAVSKTLTKEALQDNIRVTSFYPGGVDTHFRSQSRPDYLTVEDVATLLHQLINTPKAAHIQEFVVRPQVERNF